MHAARGSHDRLTTNDVTGYRTVQHLGLVRGITVLSRSVVGKLGVYVQLAETARQQAFDHMCEQAARAAPRR
jgi:uncharacterized protein YbjQ (UPF0145 family)